MINETIKRLIDPSGPGNRILTALWVQREDTGGTCAFTIADLVRMTQLAEEDVRALVGEMSGVGLVRATRDEVRLGWLGTIWMPELEEARLLGIATFMRMPMEGVTQLYGGRRATVHVELDERNLWLLIEALDITIEASTPTDKERFQAMTTVLQKHQDSLLMVAEGHAEPGEHSLRNSDLAPWFELPAATSARC